METGHMEHNQSTPSAGAADAASAEEVQNVVTMPDLFR